MYKFIFPYVLLFALHFVNTPLVIAKDSLTLSHNGWLEQRMSLDCNGRPLKEVLEEIAIFFQTEIVYEAEGADLPVQCQYSLTTVEQALNRLFNKQNSTILIEYVPKRKITVQVFGVSEYNIVSSDGRNTVQTLPFLGNMTNEALSAMQKEQFNVYRKELKDPNAIIPGVGLTRYEITKLHQHQIEQQQRNQNDPDQIVAGMEITQQQLQAIQEYQLDQYEQEKRDQNQVDPFTGLTTAEIKELHQQQIHQ